MIYENVGRSDRTVPPCIRMYHAIEEYSLKYGVPKDIAYGIAYHETRYKGPLDWGYSPNKNLGSAYGAMQIDINTAYKLYGKPISKEVLSDSIELNVELSMLYLSRLYRQYGNWSIALGSYNTGTPIINGYAQVVRYFNPVKYFINEKFK